MPTTNYTTLGTNGFGRSDTRDKLREFFEVNSRYIAVAALMGLAKEGESDITNQTVADAIVQYGIDPDKADPSTL